MLTELVARMSVVNSRQWLKKGFKGYLTQRNSFMDIRNSFLSKITTGICVFRAAELALTPGDLMTV